jgi:hypothetical protein
VHSHAQLQIPLHFQIAPAWQPHIDSTNVASKSGEQLNDDEDEIETMTQKRDMKGLLGMLLFCGY